MAVDSEAANLTPHKELPVYVALHKLDSPSGTPHTQGGVSTQHSGKLERMLASLSKDIVPNVV